MSRLKTIRLLALDVFSANSTYIDINYLPKFAYYGTLNERALIQLDVAF